jgi:membrane-bound lytic murein transglycosylase B
VHRRSNDTCRGRQWFRRSLVLAGTLLLTLWPAPAPPPRAAAVPAPPPFDAWLAALVAEAGRAGFNRTLLDRALGGVQPLRAVVVADRSQAEAPGSLEETLRMRLTPEPIAQGRELLIRHAALLRETERSYGVAGSYVVAIWGTESGYGRYVGDVPVFSALATLAWEPRRSQYFRSELFDALRMVDGGHAELSAMVGSWAGAFGQPQFMPSSYLMYAVDADGDGRRDIWTSVPDTLASIANYLRGSGWRRGEGWGREVAIGDDIRARVEAAAEPRANGCTALRRLSTPRPLIEWSALGVRQADGSSLPRADQAASLLLLEERAFLVGRNYEAILGYNCVHRYALTVSMLADEIAQRDR